MQAVLTVQALPDDAIDAAARFFGDNLDRVEALVAERPVAIAIVLPNAGPDHDHWRRALARDLGRKYAPVRVNVVGAADPATTEALLAYLGGASGITGQYCPAHG